MDRPQRDFQPSYAQRSLATPLNLSQTVEGCTLTIKQGYTDGHGIELVASFSADPDNEFTSYRTKLDDDVGNDYPSGGHSIGMGDAGLSFKLPEATPLPATLNLHLEVRVSPGHSFSHSDYLLPRSEYPSSPFKFDFSLPYFPARIVEVNQTVVSEASSMTLERLSISPSGVRGYLSIPSVDVQYARMMARVMLDITGRQNPWDRHGMLMQTPGSTNATFVFFDVSFDSDPLYKRYGSWAVTVSGLQYRDLMEMARSRGVNGTREAGAVWVPNGEPMPPMPIFPGFTAIPGEWVFNFTVPPAQE